MTASRIAAALAVAGELLAGLDDLARAPGPAWRFANSPEVQRVQRALRALLEVDAPPSRRARPGRTDPA